MSQDCLLLNGNGKPISYFPLSVVDWKTAIKLVVTRNVIIVKEHPDWFVHSPSMKLKVPSIIMLRKYYKYTNHVKFSRSNVFLRDMFTCQYCNEVFQRKELTIDHIIPKSKGGGSTDFFRGSDDRRSEVGPMRENQNAHVECNACASACVAPLCVYVSRAETFVGHVERF